jgi:hypothetical protein
MNKIKIDYKLNDLCYFNTPTINSVLSKKQCPSIYIWTITKNNKIEYFYVGETINFLQRIKFYIKPHITQKTNVYLNNLFHKYINGGYEVILNEVNFNDIEINLNNSFHRKFLENYLIIKFSDLYPNGCLNKNGRSK